jgi:hypothetical protein
MFSLDLPTLILFGWLLHWIADWYLQNEWMALNKAKRKIANDGGKSALLAWLDDKSVFVYNSHWWHRHPAAYVHAGIHTIIQLLIFPWWGAFIIGLLHLIIDCRWILDKWGQLMKQTTEGPIAIHIAIWRDQVAHLLVIALVATI